MRDRRLLLGPLRFSLPPSLNVGCALCGRLEDILREFSHDQKRAACVLAEGCSLSSSSCLAACRRIFLGLEQFGRHVVLSQRPNKSLTMKNPDRGVPSSCRTVYFFSLSFLRSQFFAPWDNIMNLDRRSLAAKARTPSLLTVYYHSKWPQMLMPRR